MSEESPLSPEDDHSGPKNVVTAEPRELLGFECDVIQFFSGLQTYISEIDLEDLYGSYCCSMFLSKFSFLIGKFLGATRRSRQGLSMEPDGSHTSFAEATQSFLPDLAKLRTAIENQLSPRHPAQRQSKKFVRSSLATVRKLIVEFMAASYGNNGIHLFLSAELDFKTDFVDSTEPHRSGSAESRHPLAMDREEGTT